LVGLVAVSDVFGGFGGGRRAIEGGGKWTEERRCLLMRRPLWGIAKKPGLLEMWPEAPMLGL